MSYHPWELLQKALPNSSLDEFDFDMPLFMKGKDDVLGRRYINGVASTEEKDLQDESVLQKGLDISYFKKNGYFNNDHKPGFENKVGQPTEAIIKKIKDRFNKSVIGLWVVGYLWPKGSHKVADDIWELAHALEAAGSDRKLGFSIQGKVLKREGNRIIKAWIQDIAITPSPVNTASWMDIVTEMAKSQWATTRDIDDLRKGINSDLFRDDPIIEEPKIFEDQKALTAGGSPLGVESLEGKEKLALKLMTESPSSLEKAIRFSFKEWKKRGYDDSFSRKLACATVARSLLA